MKNFAVLLILFFLTACPQKQQKNYNTAIPRMVSLKYGVINARSGPAGHYPVEWVYKQKNAPVEIVLEYGDWVKIKDWEDSEAWIHKNKFINSRWVKIIQKGITNIYAKPDSGSEVIAKAEDQVIGKVEKCPKHKNFCLVKFSEIKGWIKRDSVYGIYPDETID